MPDREKVIKGLECCAIDGGCDVCPYDSLKDCPGMYPTPETLMKDVLALLKAQEPRLVTVADFGNGDKYGYLPVWTEEKDGDIYCECIPMIAVTDPDDGGENRYWTSRPTDEQREAEPWE